MKDNIKFGLISLGLCTLAALIAWGMTSAQKRDTYIIKRIAITYTNGDKDTLSVKHRISYLTGNMNKLYRTQLGLSWSKDGTFQPAAPLIPDVRSYKYLSND